MVGYFGSYGDRLRIPLNINQLTYNAAGQLVAAVPAAVGLEPDPAGRHARQHHRSGEPRVVALQRALADGEPADDRTGCSSPRRTRCRSPRTRTRSMARQQRPQDSLRHRRQRGAVGLRRRGIASASTPPTSCRSTATGCIDGWQIVGRRAAPVRQPLQRDDQHQHVHRCGQRAAGPGRRPDDHRHARASGSTTASATRGSRRRCGRVQPDVGVRPARVAQWRVPLREPAAQRDPRPDVQQHGSVAHQEHRRSRAAPARSCASRCSTCSIRQPGPAGPHRHRRAARRSA